MCECVCVRVREIQCLCVYLSVCVRVCEFVYVKKLFHLFLESDIFLFDAHCMTTVCQRKEVKAGFNAINIRESVFSKKCNIFYKY